MQENFGQLREFVSRGEVTELDEEGWHAMLRFVPARLTDRPPCTERKCEGTCNLGCALRDVLAELKTDVFARYHETMQHINSMHTPRALTCSGKPAAPAWCG